MQVTGKVYEVTQTSQVTESLKKRELILEIEDNPQYPEYVKFEAIQERCSLLDSLRVGDQVEVHFNLKGRPWTDKTGKKTYFNSLQLWKVSGTDVKPNFAPVNLNSGDDNDLPWL